MTNIEKLNHIWETLYDHGNGKYKGEVSIAQRKLAMQYVEELKLEHPVSQEPVAKFLEDNLVVETERVDKSGYRVLEIREEELLRIIELYAAPLAKQVTPVTQAVRTKDLTDEEICDLLESNKNETAIEFYESIIAAYKEKNK